MVTVELKFEKIRDIFREAAALWFALLLLAVAIIAGLVIASSPTATLDSIFRVFTQGALWILFAIQALAIGVLFIGIEIFRYAFRLLGRFLGGGETENIIGSRNSVRAMLFIVAASAILVVYAIFAVPLAPKSMYELILIGPAIASMVYLAYKLITLAQSI